MNVLYPERAHQVGIDTITLDQVRVLIYSPQKTIVDCFKYRNKIGPDVVVEAPCNYRQKVRKLPVKKILQYARISKVENSHATLYGGRALRKRDLSASVRLRLLNQAHA